MAAAATPERLEPVPTIEPQRLAMFGHVAVLPRPVELLLARGVPISTAVMLAFVLRFSSVPVNLYYTRGHFAELVVIGYGLLLLASAARPWESRLHMLGAPFAVVVFGGRVAGFAQYALDGQPHLWAAVAERFVLGCALLSWHAMMVWHTNMAGRGGPIRSLREVVVGPRAPSGLVE